MTRHRFVALDGLRGLAAFVVVLWHTGATRFIPGGYLAVDLFFVLSGFVLSHSFGRRAENWSSFMGARLLRLYPLYGAGALFGAATACLFTPLDSRYWETVAANALLLPTPTSWGVYRPFPFNAPAWSLFFEILVNAVWFAVLPWLSNRWLGLIVGLFAASALSVIALSGSVDVGESGGWFLPLGAIRAAFSFFAGVACYRIWEARAFNVRAPLPFLAALFILTIAAPLPRDIIDVAAVLIIFPTVIYFGASARAEGLIGRACTSAGSASYAVYTLHAPLLVVVAVGMRTCFPLLPHADYLVAAVFIPGMLLVGTLADRYFDRPLRTWTSDRIALHPQMPPQM